MNATAVFCAVIALFVLGPWAVNRHLLHLDRKTRQ